MNENIDDFRLDNQDETFQSESEKDHWLVTNNGVTVTQILQVA